MTTAPASRRRICWLASFPKSGNTWLRILLSNLTAECDLEDRYFALESSISSSRTAFERVTGLPSSDMTQTEIDLLRPEFFRHLARNATTSLYIKVHECYYRNALEEPVFPGDASWGAVLLTRHPYDVAVSLAAHRGTTDFDFIVRQMNDPNHRLAASGREQMAQLTAGWSGHISSWLRQKEMPLLTVRYEDLLADTAATLTCVAEFLGVAQASDKQAIARAVKRSSFAALREKECRLGFIERPEKAARFFRNGRVGEGHTALSFEQKAELARYNRQIMEELGYEL